VQGEVDKLTDMGVNKIVVLSHSGYSVDQRVAANTTGVDVIVGGHSNTLLSNTEERADGPYPTVVNGVQIVQAFAYGKFLGELNVTFDDAGNVSSAEGDLIIMDASVEENADTKARISELAEALDEVRNQVVAEAAEPIDGDRSNCRYRECQMGNLVAEAILDRVRDQGIQIAIQNGGGLRASIDGGEITMGEVYTVLPFQNALSTFFVSGATIKDALENAVAQYDDPEKDGRFAQVAGMRYQIDPSQSTGERIVEILIDEAGDGTFTPIDLTKSYGVVANDFVRRGGDGYSMFNEAENAYDFGPDLAEVVADFLEREGPYAPFLDGRITILE
jgi:5'-nucleotidase